MIPLTDLCAQYETISAEIDSAVARVLRSGHFILGPELETFEREMAAFCEVPHAIGVASGTDALELALRAVGVRPGDEVITAAFGFFATPEAIANIGAVPVFVDIEPQTCNLDVAQLRLKLTERTKAVVAVHLYGQPCDMAPLLEFARAHRLKVVEDCAQAIGARYRSRRVGSFGDAAALSFFPTKNLGGYGDGGMVLTQDPEAAKTVRLLRTHGSLDKVQHTCLGRNSRLDELQAAILRVKLKYVDRWNTARHANARAYAQFFSRQQINGVTLPVEQPEREHVYHLYVVRVAERQRIRQMLSAQGIASQVHYPVSFPDQPAMAPYIASPEAFPHARAGADEVLSLPMYPELAKAQIEEVVRVFAKAMATAKVGTAGAAVLALGGRATR